MPTRCNLVIREEALSAELLPRLKGRVFHVTLARHLDGIERSGGISAAPQADVAGGFGRRENGYFRNRRMVSVFDYRSISPDELNESLGKCAPWMPGHSGADFAILMLSPDVHDRLVPWTQWKDEKAWSDMVVPYAEAGYPGVVEWAMIEQVIVVKVVESTDPHLRALRSHQHQRAI